MASKPQPVSMPFGHKAGLPPSKKYLLMRQPLFCGALLLMYQLLEKKRKGKSVYVHFFSEQNYGDDVFVHILTSRYPNNSFIISGTNDNLSAFEKQNNILVCKENRLISKVNKAVKKILKIDPLYYLRAYNCAVCLTIGGSIFKHIF